VPTRGLTLRTDPEIQVPVFATARQRARLVYTDVGEAAYEEHYRVRRLASLKESARSLGFTLRETASG
jgi:hypothetical protein